MRKMWGLLGCLACLCVPAHAWADPPPAGTKDVQFDAFVICDTFAQVSAISSAKDPIQTFVGLFNTNNSLNQPSCAMEENFTGDIVESKELGPISVDGHDLKAWAVHITGDPTDFWVLWTEPDNSTKV